MTVNTTYGKRSEKFYAAVSMPWEDLQDQCCCGCCCGGCCQGGTPSGYFKELFRLKDEVDSGDVESGGTTNVSL